MINICQYILNWIGSELIGFRLRGWMKWTSCSLSFSTSQNVFVSIWSICLRCVCANVCIYKNEWWWTGFGAISHHLDWLRSHSSIFWHRSFYHLTAINRVTVHSLEVFFPLIESVYVSVRMCENVCAILTSHTHIDSRLRCFRNWLTYAHTLSV